ncbi:hypothetical protein SDC9_127653 [bioreactor metagenome]|uniref:Uncharacterized protein n=1 Tax=bioreactor metagenome TaxID=1076179 RepID=A0A645CUM6_9ZZZZ
MLRNSKISMRWRSISCLTKAFCAPAWSPARLTKQRVLQTSSNHSTGRTIFFRRCRGLLEKRWRNFRKKTARSPQKRLNWKTNYASPQPDVSRWLRARMTRLSSNVTARLPQRNLHARQRRSSLKAGSPRTKKQLFRRRSVPLRMRIISMYANRRKGKPRLPTWRTARL